MTRNEAIAVVARRLRVRHRTWPGWQIYTPDDARRLADEILCGSRLEEGISRVADRAESAGRYDRLLEDIVSEVFRYPF